MQSVQMFLFFAHTQKALHFCVTANLFTTVLKGLLHLLPQKAPKLACFVLYLQITDIFLKNDICIL